MSDQNDRLDAYVYQKFEHDEIADCKYLQEQQRFLSPDQLVQHVLIRIAACPDAAQRLKNLRAFINATLNDLTEQAVKDLLR